MLWHKVAVNLLYSGKGNSIIHNYEETRLNSLRSLHTENLLNFSPSMAGGSPKRKQSVIKPAIDVKL